MKIWEPTSYIRGNFKQAIWHLTEDKRFGPESFLSQQTHGRDTDRTSQARAKSSKKRFNKKKYVNVERSSVESIKRLTSPRTSIYGTIDLVTTSDDSILEKWYYDDRFTVLEDASRFMKGIAAATRKDILCPHNPPYGQILFQRFHSWCQVEALEVDS